MTYQQTIEYLYSQLPMFSRIGAAAYKPNLKNTIALCTSIGNPHTKFKTIHIAGTNGKGSTAHSIAAILQTAGYKTGLYTSPHIHDFRERIKINGCMIAEQTVVNFVAKTAEITESIKPSFFELTVAMAFDYFAAEQVDYAVIETGLGGLLDSTNIITPIISIITNIGYDHQNLLGNTLAEIATQKAGIIKHDIPIIIGEALPETKAIFVETALINNAKITFVEENLHCNHTYIDDKNNVIYTVQNLHTKQHKNFIFELGGHYQTKNICTILASIYQLQKLGLQIPQLAIEQGLQQVSKITGIEGRWQILQQNPTVVVDVAHNIDGITAVLSQLKSQYPNTNYHFILGFVHDKDVDAVLKLFPTNSQYYFTNAHIPRAMPKEVLQQKAINFELAGDLYLNVNLALKAALTNAKNTDVIVICGSFFIVSELEFSG